jgi:hypothetical protein
MKNEIMSVQFRDGYMVIETLTRTYSVEYTPISEGELESLQAGILQLAERNGKKKKYFNNSDHWDSL